MQTQKDLKKLVKKENQKVGQSQSESNTVTIVNSGSKTNLGIDEDGNIDDIEFAHYVNKYKEHEQKHTSTKAQERTSAQAHEHANA